MEIHTYGTGTLFQEMTIRSSREVKKRSGDSRFVHVHIYITGKVQGVYFRQNMKQMAGNSVQGWVRNRADGSVEAVIEGRQSEINKIIEWSYKGPKTAIVENVDTKNENYTGDFSSFEIVPDY
jgi:acylphosphatase